MAARDFSESARSPSESGADRRGFLEILWNRTAFVDFMGQYDQAASAGAAGPAAAIASASTAPANLDRVRFDMVGFLDTILHHYQGSTAREPSLAAPMLHPWQWIIIAAPAVN